MKTVHALIGEIVRKEMALKFFGFRFVQYSVVLFILIGCGSPMIRRPLTRLNPMSWLFKASPKQIYTCIEKNESEFFAERQKSYNRESPIGKILIGSVSINKRKTMLSENGEVARIFLESSHYEPFWPSPVYVKDGRELPYFADFLISLQRVNPTTTEVSIWCMGAKVISGKEFTIGHAWQKNIYDSVGCSSIEEYTILTHVGKCLNHAGRPDIIYPKVQESGQ